MRLNELNIVNIVALSLAACSREPRVLQCPFNSLKNFSHFFQRMDLGECPKLHDLALRADYQLAAKDKEYYYDVDVSWLI